MSNPAKYLLSFFVGALCVAAYAWFIMKPSMQHSIDGQQLAITHLQSQLSTDTEAYKAKFARGTILYEQPVNIFGRPIDRKAAIKVWAVSADIDPVYIGTGEGFFTHYDPKSQTETVQFPARKK